MEKEAYRTYISSEDIYSVHGKYRFITVQDVLDDNGVYLGNIYDNPELLE
ncbi:YopX family protein [Kocuria sp. CPCC 205274]